MTHLVCWDVDTLNDFMLSDGKLYVPASEEITPALEALTAFARAHRIPILAHRGDFLLHKHTLDVFSNANVSTLLAALAPKAIVVYATGDFGGGPSGSDPRRLSAARRVIHATAGTFWRPILLS